MQPSSLNSPSWLPYIEICGN